LQARLLAYVDVLAQWPPRRNGTQRNGHPAVIIPVHYSPFAAEFHRIGAASGSPIVRDQAGKIPECSRENFPVVMNKTMLCRRDIAAEFSR
jgi:hypothetical protein